MLSQQRWLENKSQTLSVIKTKDKMSESQNRCTTFTKKRKETNFFLLMKMHDFIFKLSFSYNKEKICTKNKRLSTSTWNRTWKCQYKGNSSAVWLANLASINVLQADGMSKLMDAQTNTKMRLVTAIYQCRLFTHATLPKTPVASLL